MPLLVVVARGTVVAMGVKVGAPSQAQKETAVMPVMVVSLAAPEVKGGRAKTTVPMAIAATTGAADPVTRMGGAWKTGCSFSRFSRNSKRSGKQSSNAVL